MNQENNKTIGASPFTENQMSELIKGYTYLKKELEYCDNHDVPESYKREVSDCYNGFKKLILKVSSLLNKDEILESNLYEIQILIRKADNNKYDSDLTDYEDLLPFSQDQAEEDPPELPRRNNASKKIYRKKINSFCQSATDRFSKVLSFNQNKKEDDEYDKNFNNILFKLKKVTDSLAKKSDLLYGLSLTENLTSKRGDLLWKVAVTNDFLSKISSFLLCHLQDGSNASKETFRKRIKSVCQRSTNRFSKVLSLNQYKEGSDKQDRNFNEVLSKLKKVSARLKNKFNLLLKIDMTHREDITEITYEMAKISNLLLILDNYFKK